MVLLLSLNDDKEPKETLQLIKNVIKSYTAYKDKVKVKDRCVRINYVGDFHIDIVPAKLSDDKHTETSYKLSIIVRIVKYWRDLKVGKDTAPKSILLSTILANNIITENSIAATLVLTIENLVKNIDSILDDDGQPYVENPSLLGENLARDWDKDKFNIFKTKLEKFAVDARRALDEEDKKESIKLWINIFDIKFPEKLPEEETVKAISEGKILVRAQGMLNTMEGKVIPKHRFYGDVGYGEK